MRALRPLIALASVTLVSCTDPDPVQPDSGAVVADSGSEPAPDASAPDAAALPTCDVIDGATVDVPTSDGLTLQADLHTTGTVGGPGVVLLHMIPPSNTRANFPLAFRQALVAEGLTVLNLNRRGAGGDANLARTAYTGPDGKLDAAAGYDFLKNHSCAIDPERFAIVGASNGTTTALDFTIFAASDEGYEVPSALVFLTGGGYTETNNRMADHTALLAGVPIRFVFSTVERAWSAGKMPGAPAGWIFDEYDPGDHGTRMFDVKPEAIGAVAAFLADQLR